MPYRHYVNFAALISSLVLYLWLRQILRVRFRLILAGVILLLGFSPFVYFYLQTTQAAATTCYWVGDTNPALWNDATHWSSSSGGAGSTCDGGVVPGSDDTVIFDGLNLNSVNVDVAVSIAALTNAGGYSGALNTQNYSFAVAGDFQWGAGAFSAGSSAMTISGSYSNSGTFTAGTSTVTFNATTVGKTLSGTMTGGSAFYKIAFNGVGGAWAVTNSMTVTAPNALDTLVIGNGTVTLGDGLVSGSFEVDGKTTIANTAGQTGTLQTSAVPQGQTITFDINNNATLPSCANCIITVGATSGAGQGNLKIRKNTVLRLNPNATSSDTGIETESTGYLEIQGSQDDT
ncbi:hypothetical protein KJ713_03520, partial [Patescibacteria group bacterium]|nr:hypothetical protein [Patescibacteria group bacterium]